MGNKDSKIKKKLFKKLKIKENKLVEEIICPFCNKKFDGSKLSFMNSHIKSCIKPKMKINSCILYPPSFDYDLNQIIFNNILEYEKNEPNNFINKTIEDKINELKAEIKKKKRIR